MIVIGIDPSYTRTGVSILREDGTLRLVSISSEDKNATNIVVAMEEAFRISKKLKSIIWEAMQEDDVIIGVEYPILATRLGAYLGIITSKLDSLFRSLKCEHVFYLPSVAIKAHVKYENKTELVNWVKSSDIVKKFNGNHDEASAVVLGFLAKEAYLGKYKKSYSYKSYVK